MKNLTSLFWLIGNSADKLHDPRSDAYSAQQVIIIIITNEKIKVMLSRKRCTGTLQDY